MSQKDSSSIEDGGATALFDQGKFDEALEKYRTMAERGSVEAQLRLGWMYETGHGAKMDRDEARRWYLRAAQSDSSEAQFYLGKCYRREKLYQEARNSFELSAKKSYTPSLYQLGVMYELGEGVDLDKDKAYTYYQQAARLGHLRAQREIAVMMIKGKLGFKQIPKGFFLFSKVLYNGLLLGLKDPESDMIRW